MPGDYPKILESMGIDPSDYRRVSEFQAVLREKLGALTRGQQRAFSDVFRNITGAFQDYGITRGEFTRWGRELTMYALPGQRGWFNYASAAAWVRAEREK